MYHGLFSNGLDGTAGYLNDGIISAERNSDGDAAALLEQSQGGCIQSYTSNTTIHAQRGDETQRKAMKALNSCLKVAEDTNQIAQRTAVTVAMQGDQIRNIEAEAYKIEQNLDVSDRLLDSMSSWTSSLGSMFSGMFKGKDPSAGPGNKGIIDKSSSAAATTKGHRTSKDKDNDVLSSNDINDNDNVWNMNWEEKYNKAQKQKKLPDRMAVERSGSIWKALGHDANSCDGNVGDFEHDFNNGLVSLSRILSETGEQATLMNAELKEQTGTLHQVYESSNQSKIRIGEQQMKMHKIMGKR